MTGPSLSPVTPGSPTPPGVTVVTTGADGGPPVVNVSVWAPEATSVEFCIFRRDTIDGEPGVDTEVRIPLPFRDGGFRHARITGPGPGTRYGLRVDGEWGPVGGRYTNPAKLLIDPYARVIESHLRWHPLMSGFTDSGAADHRDSAPVMPKCIITGPDGDCGNGGDGGDGVPDPASNRPHYDADDLIIYEAHVKGISAAHPEVPENLRGTYAGMAHPAVIRHLTDLGVTAVELLPLQTFIDDRFLVNRGLTNYWGYQPVNWFATEPRYATDGTGPTADRELRTLVHTLHEAGIEVIVDVVYNHTGEGDELGPSLSLRGLDNNGYYRMYGAGCINDTGTGNTLAVDRPQTLQLVTESLRHWVTHFGVDGFRFDLGAVLGRVRTTPEAPFTASAAFFQAVTQDPVLSTVRLIAEPWDLGNDGYQLGAFPWPWAEWNDRFRDGIRRLWRGETPGGTNFGSLLLGSADLFSGTVPGSGAATGSARAATTSVNFLSAHDGFTLADVVSYTERHNEANGEHGADGHGHNYSDNFGVEGPTDDPEILDARARRIRGMLATLLLAQGTPMLLAGDELGNSQGGNNNAYVQDNPVGWVSWEHADTHLAAFTRRLIALRRRLPALRQASFRHGQLRADGLPDVSWFRSDGEPTTHADWHDPENRAIGVVLRGAAGCLLGEAVDGAVAVVVNPGGDTEMTLPSPGPHGTWHLELDSGRPEIGPDSGTGSDDIPGDIADGGSYPVTAQSVVVFSCG